MKRHIEVNGVANIKMLLQIEVDKAQDASNGEDIFYMNKETYNSLLEQCDLLVKYMRSYNEAINNGVQTPFWHDIRDEK
jgi:hypothetical protein